MNKSITSPFAGELNTSFSALRYRYFSNPAHTNELFTDIITAVDASILDISVIAKT
jgi:hypothetical protein